MTSPLIHGHTEISMVFSHPKVHTYTRQHVYLSLSFFFSGVQSFIRFPNLKEIPLKEKNRRKKTELIIFYSNLVLLTQVFGLDMRASFGLCRAPWWARATFIMRWTSEDEPMVSRWKESMFMLREQVALMSIHQTIYWMNVLDSDIGFKEDIYFWFDTSCFRCLRQMFTDFATRITEEEYQATLQKVAEQ